MKSIHFLLLVVFATFQISKISAQAGELDSTFNKNEYGANGDIYTISLQNDGKIIIGGGFTTYNGYTKNRIARLNSDGTIDNSFNLGTGAAGIVSTSSLQADGKVIIGGYFTTYDGLNRKRIARLNSDGSLDDTFDPGSGANGFVGTSAIQGDGKIIIGGGFDDYNGTEENYITRLNPDGSLDTAFNSGIGAEYRVFTISIQNDGKIIIGGWFIAYNGASRKYLTRLNADGTLDTSFDTGEGFNYIVYATALQNDGKILVGGDFESFNGISCNHIARLNSDGSLDTSFHIGTGLDNHVSSIAVQKDGKILIGGNISEYNGKITHNRILRINQDGSIDSTFNLGTGLNYGEVNSIVINSDDKIIIGCSFDYRQNGDKLIGSIARLEDVDINTTSIKLPNSKRVVKIYPNPASETLTIEMPENFRKQNFEIINSLGQQVISGHLIEKTSIQINNLHPGMYLLKIDNGTNVEFRKFVKK